MVNQSFGYLSLFKNTDSEACLSAETRQYAWMFRRAPATQDVRFRLGLP